MALSILLEASQWNAYRMVHACPHPGEYLQAFILRVKVKAYMGEVADHAQCSMDPSLGMLTCRQCLAQLSAAICLWDCTCGSRFTTGWGSRPSILVARKSLTKHMAYYAMLAEQAAVLEDSLNGQHPGFSLATTERPILFCS